MAEISHAIARLRQNPQPHLPIESEFEQLRRQHEARGSRDRLLPTFVTIRLFLMQVLHGNVAIAALRQLAGLDFAPASYCEARQRLPLPLLEALMKRACDAADTLGAAAGRTLRLLGRRIFIADGSTFSMSDAPPLREHFDLPAGQIPGVGYPAGKLMGLLDAATGMFVSLLALPLFQHDMRSVIGLHPMLKTGDILLGDRAFCSFAHVALLNAAGVFACFRLHQRRKTDAPRGRQRWRKPQIAPKWMAREQFEALPDEVEVRLVRFTVPHKGFRTQQVTIATTLMDEAAWPDAKIAELYGLRWDIETCFDHLKTTMGMNVLRCQSVEGVKKELSMYLIAYNLVRLIMLQAAARQGVSVRRISFIDAMRWACARMLGLAGVARLIVNPTRPGRTQLRVIRRRLKEYKLLKRPRREEEAEMAVK